ncbi:MAG: hypothetical protein ACR2J7_06725 [Luteimonas sp.]
MSTKPGIKVTLHVKDKPHGGSDSAINVTACNGAIYSYRFTGGNHGGDHGNVALYVGDAHTTIDVKVAQPGRYSILDIACPDAGNQLTFSQEAKDHWTIADACSAELHAYYTVIVEDTRAPGTRISCDPMIMNQPK